MVHTCDHACNEMHILCKYRPRLNITAIALKDVKNSLISSFSGTCSLSSGHKTRKITQYRIKPPCWYYYCPFKTFKIQNTVTCADNSGWILRKLFFVLYLFLLKLRMSQAHNG